MYHEICSEIQLGCCKTILRIILLPLAIFEDILLSNVQFDVSLCLLDTVPNLSNTRRKTPTSLDVTTYGIILISCITYISQYCGSILKLQVEFRIPSLNTAPHHPLVVRCNHPQNADLPKYLSKKEKKPFPTPILELRRAARERFKNSRGKPKRPVPPPKNGLLVKSLIPLAYNVLNARTSLINNLKKLLKAVPVHACK